MTSSAAHKHLFYMEMAKLLDAGFDIRRAAAVLMDTQLPAPQAAMLKDLHRGLEAGQSITVAFGRDPQAITELERGIIGAGERGGKLAPAFQHLADYFGMLAAARREIVAGMIYPLVVLHLGIFIGTVPTALMAGQTLGKIAGSLALALGITYVAGLAIFLMLRAILKLAPGNAGIDRMINRIPWIGKARRSMAMARFCKVYHACLLAAIPMDETAHLSAEASRSGTIREAGKKLVRAAKSGDALGPHFIAADAFPKAFARSYTTGEEAGTLDTDLARWSKLFQDEAASAMRMVSVMVPKVLYFLILGFVAWKIVAFFNGYYSGMLEMIEE